MSSESDPGGFKPPDLLNSSELEAAEAKILKQVRLKKLQKRLEKPDIDYLEYGGFSSDEEGDQHHGFIPWFCSLPGNEFLIEVKRDFIRDPFNLTNIKEMPELAEMIQKFEWDDCICTLLCKRDPSEKDIQDPLF